MSGIMLQFKEHSTLYYNKELAKRLNPTINEERQDLKTSGGFCNILVI